MERRAPVAPADEIDLYVRTYSSLLRSTGDVDVRAFEETHAFSASSLHEGALSADIDANPRRSLRSVFTAQPPSVVCELDQNASRSPVLSKSVPRAIWA